MNEVRKIKHMVSASLVGVAVASAVVCYFSDLFFVEPMPSQSPVSLPGRLVQESSEQTRFRPNYDFLGRRPNLRSTTFVLKTFEQAVGDARLSTVQILSPKQQLLSLGLAVDSEGWIITKASQLVPDGLVCRLSDGSRIPATIMHVNHDLDIALLKVKQTKISAVKWPEPVDIHVGGWLTTTSVDKVPVGIGVVSVGPRKIPSTQAVLGVSLGALGGNKEGALVADVIQGSGAERAGIQEGDVIVSIDGAFISNTDALQRKVRTLRAGQRVSVVVTRNKSSITMNAQLMDLSSNLHDPTEMEVNGSVSARASGFPRAFQHDTVLAPHQCGGPVVDTHGRVVGINIARAGRVASYALPLDVVVPAVQEMMMVAKSRPVAEELKTVPIGL